VLTFDEGRDFSRMGRTTLLTRATNAGMELGWALDQGTWHVTFPKRQGKYRIWGVYNNYAGSGDVLLAYRTQVRVRVRGTR
jgi:hypothetical protein